MIERVHIKNFKSIYDLDINVGRVNLFIGENGSGKSNLLEALVFVSASQSNKLDNEFLVFSAILFANSIISLLGSLIKSFISNESIFSKEKSLSSLFTILSFILVTILLVIHLV